MSNVEIPLLAGGVGLPAPRGRLTMWHGPVATVCASGVAAAAAVGGSVGTFVGVVPALWAECSALIHACM